MASGCGAVLVVNCSRFYRDRLSAMREMLTGGDGILGQSVAGQDRFNPVAKGWASGRAAVTSTCPEGLL